LIGHWRKDLREASLDANSSLRPRERGRVSFLSNLRRQLLPTNEEVLIDQLMDDVDTFEVNGWVEWIIDYLAFDPRSATELPPNIMETWRSLTHTQQAKAFMFAVGAIRALIHAPQEPPHEPPDPVGASL
jgi:hypothetical protein